MRVILGEVFKNRFKNFPKSDKQIIFDFIVLVDMSAHPPFELPMNLDYQK